MYWLAIPVGLFAFIHAALQRADAYTATDKLTKPAWLGITGGATAALVLFPPGGSFLILWLIALVAVLVYIVDVICQQEPLRCSLLTWQNPHACCTRWAIVMPVC